jgi:acetoin utilization protein AcuB
VCLLPASPNPLLEHLMPASRFEVRDWMTPVPETVSPECSLLEARRTMDSGGFRHLPVVDGESIVGIVSDRDLRSASPPRSEPNDPAQVEKRLAAVKVRQIMTPKPVVVGPHTSLADAARLLSDRQVGALPVVSGQEIVGILSETDALRALVSVLALLRSSGRDDEVRQGGASGAPGRERV